MNKEKFLHGISKKDNLASTEPIQLKVLKIWGIAYLIFFTLGVIILLVLHLEKTHF